MQYTVNQIVFLYSNTVVISMPLYTIHYTRVPGWELIQFNINTVWLLNNEHNDIVNHFFIIRTFLGHWPMVKHILDLDEDFAELFNFQV